MTNPPLPPASPPPPAPYEPGPSRATESATSATRTVTAVRGDTPRDEPQSLDALSWRIVEHAPYGIVAVEVATRHIRLANRVARQFYERLSGARGDTLIGQRLDALLPWLGEHGVFAQIDLVGRTGEAMEGLTLDHVIMPGRVGLTYWSYDVVALSEPGCAATEALITIHDRTEDQLEHQRAEHATFSAQLYAEKLEAVIEQIGEAVIVLDQHGRMVAYNRAALFFAWNRHSVERARARGVRRKPKWRIRHTDGTPVVERELPAWRALLTGAPVVACDYCIQREQGEETAAPVLIHAAPMHDEAKVIVGVVVTIQDITAIKEVERLKDEFISVAGHELRQPLTVIQGQAQLLHRHVRRQMTNGAALNVEVLRQIAEAVESQTTRLNQLVSDLLDMSRMQSGELTLDVAPTPLLSLLGRLLDLQRDASLEHHFLVETRLPQGIDELVGVWDRRRIEQILLNLLSNSVKYSPDGGDVRIEVEWVATGRSIKLKHGDGARQISGPAAHIIVRDDGIGIPREALPNLFKRFYRAANTVGIQGTGLGLSICRQLALAHNGDLWVESSGIGQGSAFHLALPAHPQ